MKLPIANAISCAVFRRLALNKVNAMSTDAELLEQYARDHDQCAFTELVQRHVGLVYAAALRRTGGRPDLAEDIAQQVFCALAARAAVLHRHPALIAWLYRGTRNAAIDAIRAERRREKLAHTLSAMPDTSPTPASHVDWEQLRPVLDEAMDQLKERDREIMLLRYFNGLTFAEVGARLDLAENTARMRAERALDKLRVHLGRRGVTSTPAALGLLLANSALASAPAGVASTVATAALATAPAGAAAGLLFPLLMTKIAAPALTAVLAAGTTALVWFSATNGVTATELAALRQENARLAHATAADASATSLAAIADEYAAQTTAIARALEQRRRDATAARAGAAGPATPTSAAAQPAATARGHRDHGQATARDAAFTFAWASDLADPAAFSKLIFFDGRGREHAAAILASMPASIREQYRSPEEFYGLVLAATTLQGPPPGADVLESSMVFVELSPGRVAMRRSNSSANYHEYQLTTEGWKWVLPEQVVPTWVKNLNSETLARLSASQP